MLVSSTNDALLAVKTFENNYIKNMNENSEWVYSIVQSFIPIYTDQVTEKLEKDIFYIIPKVGDVLKEIQILGNFKTAQLYQHDWRGNHEVIYDIINCSKSDETIIKLFDISGIPLMCIGKNIFLDIIDAKDNLIVNSMFGFSSLEYRQEDANFGVFFQITW